MSAGPEEIRTSQLIFWLLSSIATLTYGVVLLVRSEDWTRFVVGPFFLLCGWSGAVIFGGIMEKAFGEKP